MACRPKLIAWVCAVALVLSACSGSDSPVNDQLEGRAFTYRSGLGVEPIEGNPLTLMFTRSKNGRLNAGGTDGCNGFGGWVEVADGSLAWDSDSFGREDMGCAEPVMAVGVVYLDALITMETFVLEGDQLTLRGASGELIFDAAPEIDEDALTGPVWILQGTIVGGEIQPEFAVDAFIDFDGGGFVGSTGCRDLTGNWSRPAGNGIAFTTMRADGACNPELASFDSFVIGVLGDGFTVEELTPQGCHC